MPDALRNLAIGTGVLPTGQILWHKIGVYALTFDDDTGKATELTHKPSGMSCDIPTNMLIDRSFNIIFNWNEEKACVEQDAVKHGLMDAMKTRLKGNMWHKTYLKSNCEKWVNIKKLAIETLEAAKQTTTVAGAGGSSGDGGAHFLDEQRKTKAKAAAAKARAALATRAEEASKRRRTSFQRGTSNPPMPDPE